jgi:serine/threonine-protein kinase
MPATEPPDQSPDKIGRYEVLEELGRGAMGVVLLAHDPVLGRRVAVKHLRPDLRLEDDERELLMKRMRQEARALARVSHAGIVALHDIGEDEERGTFLVFEHAKGPTLSAVLGRGRLTKEGTARLAREMGAALDAAHASSIVHRDVKPGNVILTEDGSRIADFGVARLPDSTLTRAGARVGTPAYSAPECVREGEHSPKSDQFSMSACLYEGLSGRRAYPGDDAIKVARAIQKDPPLPIAKSLGLSPRVDEVLLRAMAHDPKRRYENCREFGQALSEALLGLREAQLTLPDEQSLLQIEEHDKRRALGSAVLFFLIGATVATAIVQLRRPADEPKVEVQTEQPPARPAYLSPVPEKKP